MNQFIVAGIALVVFSLFAISYSVWWSHRESCRKPYHDVHSGPDDLEKRARRAF